MVPIDESALGRWSRLKKARQDRAAKKTASRLPSRDESRREARGRAAPVAIPVEVSGDYRPWLPPLTSDRPVGVSENANEVGTDAEAESVAMSLSDEERAVAEELSLPDIASLNQDSDYRAFLTDGVPDRLRRLALRKLWSTNPLFGLRDGLDDYDQDFQLASDFVFNLDAKQKFTALDNETTTVAEGGTNDGSPVQEGSSMDENEEPDGVTAVDDSMDRDASDAETTGDDDDPGSGQNQRLS